MEGMIGSAEALGPDDLYHLPCRVLSLTVARLFVRLSTAWFNTSAPVDAPLMPT